MGRSPLRRLSTPWFRIVLNQPPFTLLRVATEQIYQFCLDCFLFPVHVLNNVEKDSLLSEPHVCLDDQPQDFCMHIDVECIRETDFA